MEHEDFAAKLAAVDARAKSNTHRLNELEEQFAVLHKLATAMEVMAKKMEYQAETVSRIEADVDSIGQKVDAIEKKPARRWEGLVEKALWAVCAAVIAFLLAKIGL